jgi:hypothetical protein
MKNKLLVIFFILLSLSIGLASTNLPLSPSYAQNSALLQSGNGDDDVEQETEQGQSSDQDNQVVSGDSSVLSGNNLSCQNQGSSDGNERSIDVCISDGTNNDTPPQVPNGEAVLKTISILRANGCNWLIPTCPVPNGEIHIIDQDTHEIIVVYIPRERSSDPLSLYIGAPIGHEISIQGYFPEVPRDPNYLPDVINIRNIQNSCGGLDSCNFVMPADGATVEVNFHYRCNMDFC